MNYNKKFFFIVRQKHIVSSVIEHISNQISLLTDNPLSTHKTRKELAVKTKTHFFLQIKNRFQLGLSKYS